MRYCQPIPKTISLSRSDNDPAGRTMVVPSVCSDSFMLWFNFCCSLTSNPGQGNKNSGVKISCVGHGQKQCVVGAQATVMTIQTISNKAPRGFLWKTTVWQKYKLRQSFVSFILITFKVIVFFLLRKSCLAILRYLLGTAWHSHDCVVCN